MTKKELYFKNQKNIKILSKIMPIVFWVFIGLAIFCFIVAIKNSLGNISEILNLLDSKKYNDEQIKSNYYMLVEKYGELQVGSGGKGFTIVFINIKNAVFSGFMIINAVMSLIFLISAFVLGKWLLPLLKKKYESENQDMCNIAILDMEEKK